MDSPQSFSKITSLDRYFDQLLLPKSSIDKPMNERRKTIEIDRQKAMSKIHFYPSLFTGLHLIKYVRDGDHVTIIRLHHIKFIFATVSQKFRICCIECHEI